MCNAPLAVGEMYKVVLLYAVAPSASDVQLQVFQVGSPPVSPTNCTKLWYDLPP